MAECRYELYSGGRSHYCHLPKGHEGECEWFYTREKLESILAAERTQIAETARRQALEVAAEICQRQSESLAETIKNTNGSEGSTQILTQQMASAAGCAWAIREALPHVPDEKWAAAMEEFKPSAELQRVRAATKGGRTP